MGIWAGMPRKIVAVVAAIFGFTLALLSGARAMLDLLGRGATLEDLAGSNAFPLRALDWLFTTPWWVPGLLAALITATLIYFILRPAPNSAPVAAAGTTDTFKVGSAYPDATL